MLFAFRPLVKLAREDELLFARKPGIDGLADPDIGFRIPAGNRYAGGNRLGIARRAAHGERSPGGTGPATAAAAAARAAPHDKARGRGPAVAVDGGSVDVAERGVVGATDGRVLHRPVAVDALGRIDARRS